MLELPREYVERMVGHAQDEAPNECCGIIAGQDGRAVAVYPMTNAERSPYRYRLDPKEFFLASKEIEDCGRELLAFYHSHTHSPAYPSATDVRLATGPDGTSMWPGVYYILVSLADPQQPVVRAFRIVDGAVSEEDLRITP